jgi:formylglycine-generating enzyme required for sulfatase activity
MTLEIRSPSICPRCQALIRGTFRYCPECAFRLRPGARPTPPAPTTRSRLAALPLVLLLVGVVAGAFLAGRELFREPLPGPRVESAVMTVADIPETLVRLPAAPAVYDERERRWETLPEGDELLDALEGHDPEGYARALEQEPDLGLSGERLISRWLAAVERVLDETGVPFPQPVMTRPFSLMAYEVTSGQYAEFLRSVEEDPTRLARRYAKIGWLWSWSPAGDGAEDEERAFLARTYVEYWWQALVQHERARLAEQVASGEPPPAEIARPAWLALPLEPRLGARLLVPPHWVQGIPTAERMEWKVPAEPNLPVTEVCWFDAQAFAQWASERLGMLLLLPNVYEWQRAFHRGHAWHSLQSEEEAGWVYPWGRDPREWACNNLSLWPRYRGGGTPAPLSVRTRYGGDDAVRREERIYSIAGNAAEWMANAEYRPEEGGPFLPYDEEQRGDRPFMARRGGGSWRMGIADCRLDRFQTLTKTERLIDSGFRLLVRDTIGGI